MNGYPEIGIGVSERIRKTRMESVGLSRQQFGQRVGVSQRYINMLESGQRQPSQPLIIAIAYKMGVEELWLRTGKGRFRRRR